MGAILSLNNSRTRESGPHEVSQSEMRKRQRLSSCLYDENPRLIPSLPDEISIQILARVPRIHYLKLRMVSRTWKTTIMTAELFNLRKQLGTTEEWLYVLTKVESDKLIWHALDPLAGIWQKLPPMPRVFPEDESRRTLTARRMWKMVGSSIRIADVIMSWLRRKNALDRMPFCGCAVGAVDGCLYVLGGFSRATALSCAWTYNPVINSWSESTPMSMGRAYSKTGILNNKLYVVGGVTRGPGGLAPLQSGEVFDPKTGLWSQIPSMPFTKAQVLPTAFLADLLKPIATGMTSYKGRLFVPQSLYCWPFFVDVGGEVYDPEVNSWSEMPTGMGEGWPARQAGTKMSVTVDGELYALDPSSSLDNANIKLYDYQDDAWKVVAEDVPIRDFTESESPYLLAGFLGKLHVITKDANNNVAVLQAYVPNHLASTLSAPSSSPDIASEISEPQAESEADLWKVVATRNAQTAELYLHGLAAHGVHYLHRPGPTLQDSGFFLLPEVGQDNSYLSESLFTIVFFFFYLVDISPVCFPEQKNLYSSHMVQGLCLFIVFELEKKRKERAQLAYERKKLLNKLRIKAEKVVDEKLGPHSESIAPIKY